MVPVFRKEGNNSRGGQQRSSGTVLVFTQYVFLSARYGLSGELRRQAERAKKDMDLERLSPGPIAFCLAGHKTASAYVTAGLARLTDLGKPDSPVAGRARRGRAQRRRRRGGVGDW